MNGFKAFLLKGNLIDVAVGIIIGAAFTQLANSLVQDIIMPPISILVSNVSFDNWFIVIKEGTPEGPYKTLAEAKKAGASMLRIGVFVNVVINFIVTSICVYALIKGISQVKSKLDIADVTKTCPFCCSKINIKAIKCPVCTADLDKK